MKLTNVTLAILAFCIIRQGLADVDPIYYATDGDGTPWAYNKKGGGYINLCCSSGTQGIYSGDIVVPEKLGSLTVSSIGDAFNGCRKLKSVTIPDSVKSIGYVAFQGCVSLETIKGANALITIDKYAFNGCSSLKKFNVPETLKTIKSNAFAGCSGLTGVYIMDLAKWCDIAFGDTKANPLTYAHNLYLNGVKVTAVTIPDSVKSIRSCVFSGCNGLTSVAIGNSVTNIAAAAFSGCSSLTNMSIPDSVAIIGSYAFEDCSRLTSVTIPDSVTSIGSLAFKNCSGLTSVHITDLAKWCGISFAYGANPLSYAPNLYLNGEKITELTIPDGTTNIMAYAFHGCIGLTSVTMPESVTSIGSYAFSGCSGLTSVTIPVGVKSIASDAFSSCSGLTNVTIPESVTNINSYAFSGCSKLSTVTIPQYVCTNKLSSVFSSSYQTITNVVISDSVTSIGNEAFKGCIGLTNVTIPDSVMSIGSSAFSGCSGLTSVTIPDSVMSIGSYAFYNCSGLTGVYITDLVKWCDISFGGSNANPLYYAHNLYLNGELIVELTIPDFVMSIGSSAFSGCSGLTSVTIPSSVTSIGDSAFSGCSGLTSVHVTNLAKWCCISFGNPAANPLYYAHNLYLNGELLTELTIPDSVASIGSYAFSDCGGLTSVTIPDGVTSIGSSAFSGCSSLTSVTIPDSVTSIGYSAFSGCSGLTSVTIPQYVCSSRLSSAFPSSYQTITNVVISDSVMSIGQSAFSGCSALTSVTIPRSVTNIGIYAFDGCNDELFDMSSIMGVKIIDGWAVGYTSSLPEIVKLSSISGIAARAFYACSTLESVIIADSVTSIGSLAFGSCSKLRRVYLPTTYLGATDVFPSSSAIIRYKPHQIVSFNTSDGIVADISLKVRYDEPYGELPFVSRAGYDFCGWVYDGEPVSSDTQVFALDDHTLVATWIPIKFTVTFDANGGYGGWSESVDYNSEMIAPTVAREGYSFLGWSPEVSETVPLGGATYMAQWAINSYDVVFDANGGAGGTRANIEYGSPIIAPTVTRTGYTFNGWSPSVAATVPANDVTYTAQWKINTYALTFDANGGSGGVTATHEYGSPIVAPTVTRTGYTFAGWSPSVPSTVPAENATYTAQWQINRYTMTFNANGGVGGKTVIQDYGSQLSAPTVTREGYTFTGWSPSVPSTVPAGNATYRAQWQVNRYSITFDANGGVGGKTVLGSYGSWLSAPTVTRTGYTFVGWSPSVPSAVPAENATYTAQWQINQYTVTFDANGGVGGKTIVLDYGSPLSAPAVTREGHTFNGWSPSVPFAVPDGDATYTAQWMINKYTVTFNANGGTCGTTELSIDYGTSVGELPVPVRDNAVFLGWFTEAEGGVKVDADTVVTGELVLYAHWLFEVESPVVVSTEGNPFRADSCEVSIECATEGAAIYYTDDGTTPRLNDDYLYTGPFTITDTTVIKAIAVFQELRSGYVTTTIEKHTLTFEEALGSVEGVAFAIGGDALWSPIVYDAAKRGDICAKSGAIGNRAETWLSATVEGAGAMTFWCKTSCEHDEDNMFTWDRLMIYTNGVEIAEWRMDGETDWTERALSFEGGVNTVKWVYYKDRTGADGEDCAWVDAVVWTPSAAADPIPAVAVDADAATVNAAVDGAGFVDAAVKVAIGGSATEYNAFKTWAAGVKGATGDALAGEAAVVANAHAAAAYLLGVERLFVNEPTVEIGELAIVGGESAGTTKMTVAVTVKDGASAVAVDAAKVAAMFEATGDLGDWNGVAKLTPTVTTSGTDASGKMTFVVTPGDGTANRAFLRIKR